MLTLIEIYGSSFLACWVKDTQVYLYIGCKLCFLLYWLYTNLNFVELNYSFSFICANTMERTLKQLVVASACSKMWEDITRIVSEETAEGIKFRIFINYDNSKVLDPDSKIPTGCRRT